jgi:hypothetical protein
VNERGKRLLVDIQQVLPGSSLPLNGSATAVSRCIARIARGITTWVEAYEAAANVDKTYRIAVLVRLRSSDAGDGDHQIGLGPFDAALGHGFGNLTAVWWASSSSATPRAAVLWTLL